MNQIDNIYNALSGNEKQTVIILASKVVKELAEYQTMGINVDIKDIAIIAVNVCAQYANPKTKGFDVLVKLVITDIFEKLKKAA